MLTLTSLARDSRAVLLHQLSKKSSHNPFKKLHGLPVSAVFHPTRSIFFVATKKHVRVYDLVKTKLIKKLEAGVREISSISIHPGGNQLSCPPLPLIVWLLVTRCWRGVLCCNLFCVGDNVIVGSKEGKMCWFDMDLSSQPYKTLKYVVTFWHVWFSNTFCFI